jgi:hypothetical protein
MSAPVLASRRDTCVSGCCRGWLRGVTDGPQSPQPTRKTAYWTTSYRPGGWVRLDTHDQAPSGFRGKVFLQLQPSDDLGGRLLIHQALMTGDNPISARTWRQVPFAEVEAYAVNPEVRSILELPVEITTTVIGDLDKYFDDTEKRYGPATDFIPEMPYHPLMDLPHMHASYQPVQPPGGRITDDFLRHVATAYARATAEERAPGPAIAAEAGVPVRTVHGWITQARKKGMIPPGRRGRAG